MRRRIFAMLVAVLLVPLLSGRVAAGPEAPNYDLEPLPSDVWSATADGAITDVLIVLEDQASLPRLPHFVSRATRGRLVYEALWQAASASQAPLRAWLDAQGVSYRSFYIVNALLVQADRELAQKLARRTEVAQVLANPEIAVEPQQTPLSQISSSYPLPTDLPWGIAHLGAPEVWSLGYRGEGVVVAGQDTGYDWTHPALKRQYRGWNGTSADHDYNWHDAIHKDADGCGPDAVAPCDDATHGTHTMGTIVGDDGEGHQIGVAPGAEWIGCRNMVSEGGGGALGTPATYIECFEFFLAPYPVGGDPSQGDPSKAPDVVNNSWSCPAYEGCTGDLIGLLEETVNRVRAAGIMVVASAGNDGWLGCGSVDEPPAMYDASTTVGAVDENDIITSFSSRGTGEALLKPDIVAPGVSVLSSVPGGGYSVSSGTSMSAPHVTGVVALMWSSRPSLRGRIDRTEALLTSTAVPLISTQCEESEDAVPNSVYGWGRIEALAAVNAALRDAHIFNFHFYLPLLFR